MWGLIIFNGLIMWVVEQVNKSLHHAYFLGVEQNDLLSWDPQAIIILFWSWSTVKLHVYP
jgi:hypothetical protein